MANTRVFSWKITDDKYGYLFIPNKSGNGLITDRITEDDKLRRIADEVSSWGLAEYEEKFNELNSLIRSKYGVSIPGNASDYYDSGYTRNYIILGGKDGNSRQIDEKELNNFIVQNVEKVINDGIKKAQLEFKAEVNNVKDATIGKFDEKVRQVNENITTVKNEIESKNTILSNKLEAASSHIEQAAQLFDFGTCGVTKEHLSTSINKANAAAVEIERTNNRVTEMNTSIQNATTAVATLNERATQMSDSMATLNTRLNTEINRINNEMSVMGGSISRIEAEIAESATTTGDTNLSKSMPSDENYSSGYKNVIENNDGTYTIEFVFGNDKYNIRVFGFGNYIKDDEFDAGFTLARNGFRYMDKSGSYMSMVDGNIVLSNAKGNGKIEIKEDGVYINGKKQ